MRLFIAAILVLGVASPSQAERLEEAALYRAAQDYMNDYPADQQGLEKAAEALRQLAHMNDKNPRLYVGTGRLIYKLGYINGDNHDPATLKRAKELFAEAIRLDPTCVDAYIFSVYVSLYEKNIDAAKAFAAQVEKLSKDAPRVELLYAEIAKRERHVEEVEQRATRVLSATDDKRFIHDAHALLAWTYMKQNRDALAEQEFLTLIQLSPTSPWAKSNYSQFLTNCRRYDEAIDQAKQALALMDYGMAHHDLSRAYYWKGHDLLWKEKRHAEAGEAFSQAILHNPKSARAHYGLAAVYLRLGYDHRNRRDLQKAEQEFLLTLELEPTHEQAPAELRKVRHYLQALENCAQVC